MKQWRLIYSHSDKKNLWRGIYRRELIPDTQDENGDYALLDADTGEVMPFVVKHLAGADAWACVQYVDVGA